MEQDAFDRQLGSLHGLPDVVNTKATTIRVVMPLVGQAVTFIVQTYRQRDRGDVVFLEIVSGPAHTRLVLPDNVVGTIVRQRDALAAKVRRKLAREKAQERKDAGFVPFQRREAR